MKITSLFNRYLKPGMHFKHVNDPIKATYRAMHVKKCIWGTGQRREEKLWNYQGLEGEYSAFIKNLKDFPERYSV